MPRPDDLHRVPLHVPEPVDDGACDHLRGAPVPSVPLLSTRGRSVDLSGLPGRTVVYVYPRTGRPDEPPLPGWDLTPGARGCTPQSCAYRDHHAELSGLGVAVFGLAINEPGWQREAAARLHLPFELLSDADRALTNAMRLPTFEVAGLTLLRRFTLVLRDGLVEHLRYPVWPTDGDAAATVAWLRDTG
jgi:peroxiredoxin